MTAPTTARRVSQAELARELGVSRQAVNDLVGRGVLVLGTDRKLDLDEARVVVLERVRPTGKTAAAVAASVQTPATPPAAAQAKTDNAAAYYVAKASREASEAGMAALKLAQMQGALIDREAAIQSAFTSFRQLRNSLNFLPRKLSGRLVNKTSPREIQQLLEDEIRATLLQFQQRTLASMATNMGSQLPPDEGTGE
jgi:hypothetical protein